MNPYNENITENPVSTEEENIFDRRLLSKMLKEICVIKIHEKRARDRKEGIKRSFEDRRKKTTY